MKDKFWFDDLTVLYKDKNYLQFFPSNDMSDIQKLNAIARFSLYLMVLLLLMADNDQEWLYLPILLLLLTIIFAKIEHFQQAIINNTKNDELKSKDEKNTKPQKKLQDDMCVEPTEDNPFMNPLLSDQEVYPDTGKKCDMDTEQMKKKVMDKFYDNLYMDIDDAYELHSSARQFFSLPNQSYPNDQKEFAEWLYNSPQSCKQDQSACLRYEDLRFKRI